MLNGGAYLQSLVDCAIQNREKEIVIEGNYEIEKAIVLPSITPPFTATAKLKNKSKRNLKRKPL